jgi:outer membrane immunogenic protein
MMRRISLSLLAATAMGLIVSQGASAADMRMPVKAPAPLPPPVQDWSGIYVGLEGGYGWGKQNSNFDPFFSNKENAEFRKEVCNQNTYGEKTINCGADAAIGSVSQSGWLFGGFVGAQKQWGSWVLGIEADFDGTDIKGSQTVTARPVVESEGSSSIFLSQQHTLNTKIDELGTLRGKVGWAWSPNWMFYGTGGLAWAHARNDFSASQNECESDGSLTECIPFFSEAINGSGPAHSIGGVGSSAGVSMLGWTVGAGLDYKWQLDQGSAVIFGVEYLHYQFGEHSLAFGGPLCTCADNTTFTIGNATQTIDAIKGRISYLFSIH